MITDLEKNYIKQYIPLLDDDTSFVISADKSNIKISKFVNAYIETYRTEYQKSFPGKIGKSKLLHQLLKKLAADQPAIFHLERVDMVQYNRSVLFAIQTAKKIFSGYCDERITTVNDCVMAILAYSFARKHEEKNNLPTTGYIDYAIEDNPDNDIEPEITTDKPIQKPVHNYNVSELFSKARNDGLALEVD